MKDYTILEIKTVLNPPIILNFTDYVNCPICDNEIDVKDMKVDNNSSVDCENCNHTIKFKIVKI
ncbi:MAG: hypothetical protein EAZ75_09225 [Flavobacteriia bacterium]|jgi:hypothetical protein|nr:MAG: hypothetical protein EAZ75_09225 [Flavobacteriia bacterium]